MVKFYVAVILAVAIRMISPCCEDSCSPNTLQVCEGPGLRFSALTQDVRSALGLCRTCSRQRYSRPSPAPVLDLRPLSGLGTPSAFGDFPLTLLTHARAICGTNLTHTPASCETHTLKARKTETMVASV